MTKKEIICRLTELTCIGGLVALAVKRNHDAYDAELKCINLEQELLMSKLQIIDKDFEIFQLKKEIEILKGESSN